MSSSPFPSPGSAPGVFSSPSVDQAATFRSFFGTYNSLSEECFNACVWDFGVRPLRAKEVRCVDRCAGHRLTSTKEIGERFAEAKEKEMESPAGDKPKDKE